MHRALSLEKATNQNDGNYAGIGIAMVTLIDNTVRVTMRHSDSAPSPSEAALMVMPAVLDHGPEFSSLGGDAGCLDLGAGLPVHRDEAGGLLDPPQPAADRREGREVEVAAVGDMGVAVQRDVGDG